MTKRMKLSRSERAFERAAARGELRPAPKEVFDRIAAALARYCKTIKRKA